MSDDDEAVARRLQAALYAELDAPGALRGALSADGGEVIVLSDDDDDEGASGAARPRPPAKRVAAPVFAQPRRDAGAGHAKRPRKAAAPSSPLVASAASAETTARTLAPRPGGRLELCHHTFETLDPTPNIFVLFRHFDAMFFGSRLAAVEVKWSKRMTLCAGICRYDGGRGGAVSIALSMPLLRLRPRSDLVNTLLHEMIHALLFLERRWRDHDGHGPEFLGHADRINASAGTLITVYHTFHAEVRGLVGAR
jgi:hypothetical protein